MRSSRPLSVLGVVLGALALLLGGASPALADEPPDSPVVALDATGASVDDFEFASFDAVYRLSRDGDRSALHTVETLVAVFPDYDQNRGIRRALVTNYKGHSTSLEIESVTDENGVARPYEISTDGDFTLVTIAVPQGQYVYGEQTYVIEYTQRDVTATSTDLADGVERDEFYWDVNGTGWAQPFGTVTASVEVDVELAPALTGEAFCYYGYAGATDRCDIAQSGSTFEAGVTDLFPYQNMTVVVAFAPGTFGGAPFWTYVPILPLIALALVVLAVLLAIVLRVTVLRDAKGRGIVVAQYEPPEGMSALLAANLVGKRTRGMAATLVDLAVRGNLRIVEHDQGFSKVFGVQRVSSQGLGPDEQRVMGALFSLNPFSLRGGLPGIRNLFSGTGIAAAPETESGGEVRWLTKGDQVLGRQVVALSKAVALEAVAGGLRRKPPGWPLGLVVLAFVLAALLLVIQIFVGGETDLNIAIVVVGLNVIPWLGVAAGALVGGRRPLTSRGAELREHLDGLREFIRLAEADRLRMLQSVSGADRIPTDDGAAIVRIYERLLPYAVLFGLEREWAKELSKYYDENPPEWYSGTSGVFHVAAFAAGIGALSSSVSTSYSGSSSSSSSGGGGGGGSSGGGGGGGGGGGV